MASAVTAATAPRPVPGTVRRVLDIARVQTFHGKPLLGVSLGALVAGPLVLVALTAALGDVNPPSLRIGLLIGLCCSATLLQVLTVIQTFPFVLGLGRTRRAFSAATAIVAAVHAALHATVLTLLVQIELATDGWGLSAEVIAIGPLRRLSAPEQWIFLTAVLLALAMTFALAAVVHMRWGNRGIRLLFVIFLAAVPVVALMTVVLAVVVMRQFGRPGVEALVDAGSSFPLLAGGPLVLAVLLGLAGFAVLRRVAP